MGLLSDVATSASTSVICTTTPMFVCSCCFFVTELASLFVSMLNTVCVCTCVFMHLSTVHRRRLQGREWSALKAEYADSEKLSPTISGLTSNTRESLYTSALFSLPLTLFTLPIQEALLVSHLIPPVTGEISSIYIRSSASASWNEIRTFILCWFNPLTSICGLIVLQLAWTSKCLQTTVCWY